MNLASHSLLEPRELRLSQAIPVIFIVDDDISVRESLELLLQTAGWKPQAFCSAHQFLSQARLLVPSCLILDVTMPDIDGFDLQRRVADCVHMPIIFISGYADIPMSVRAIKAGAVEFLPKPFNDEVLLKAISHAVSRSKAALDRVQELQVLQHRYACLSRREREVMGWVVAGRLNKQVAGELGIKEITVKVHRGKVMRKMKVQSLAELVNVAARLRRGTTDS